TLTFVGSLVRFASQLLDWISRWDTLNLHAKEVLHTASVVSARVPPGTSEICYVIALFFVLFAVGRRRPAHAEVTTTATTAPFPEPQPIAPASESAWDRLQRQQKEGLERRKLRAEAEVAEEQLRQIREQAARAVASSLHVTPQI